MLTPQGIIPSAWRSYVPHFDAVVGVYISRVRLKEVSPTVANPKSTIPMVHIKSSPACRQPLSVIADGMSGAMAGRRAGTPFDRLGESFRTVCGTCPNDVCALVSYRRTMPYLVIAELCLI